jgi:hypothetical protein
MPYRPIQLVLRFRSTDFAQWKQIFDEYEEVRVRHGALGHEISRSVADPHEFLALVPFASQGGAVGYSSDPERHALMRAIFGRPALRSHSWDETIHELVDASAYGYIAPELGRAWSPVSHHVGIDGREDR